MPLNYPFPPDIKNMEPDVFREIWRRVYYEDDSVNMVFIGSTGTGKSTSAHYFGWVLDRDYKGKHLFSVEGNVCHRFTDFIKAVRDCKRKGKVIILEEAGTREGIYKREWFTSGNKAAAELMQIARRWNLILIFVLPARKYLDTDVRDFFSIQVWAKGKDLRKRRTYASIKYIDRDMERGKEYPKYPTQKTDSGITVSVTEYTIPPPPRYIMEEWKKYETQFKTEILDRSIAMLAAEETKEGEKEDRRGGGKIDLDNYFKALLNTPGEYTKKISKDKKPRFNKELIYGKLRVDGRGPGMPTAKILAEMGNNEIDKEENAQ